MGTLESRCLANTNQLKPEKDENIFVTALSWICALSLPLMAMAVDKGVNAVLLEVCIGVVVG